ncbi:Diaminopimelate epimerase [Candidatus Ornithobacterium hominis]|uniref:Diaminopimelate epimerase n=1 Tax=Candidatus Ornithobacterium hominis TaxID=2497989 RepID=A0A383TYN5_9FLAO|nr:diaminopimelate epimerase [Candidatus Ornithobacterium hominis]MCT7904102.1 diaminopimelate epimerase [Candidatus Ornithobacterium hominis]SZD72360.1 Diaminopimelate epimerase [Candidatus Ornithobacterium hominis]
MEIYFYKYQGTGNDFVMIDAINQSIKLNREQINQLCDRKFGIGADGLIILTRQHGNFHMNYYNSDGKESSMCGNGGRCFIKFLSDLNLIEKKVEFFAIDGWHSGKINENQVSLELKNIYEIQQNKDFIFLDTGSPHHVEFRENIDDIDVAQAGRAIRYSKLYPNGTNVNFVEIISSEKIKVRTYERGVEDETLSCGTGVTAAAISANFLSLIKNKQISVETKGGDLQVCFDENESQYTNVWLTGPAEQVFKGLIEI